jgi:ferredoxin
MKKCSWCNMPVCIGCGQCHNFDCIVSVSAFDYHEEDQALTSEEKYAQPFDCAYIPVDEDY